MPSETTIPHFVQMAGVKINNRNIKKEKITYCGIDCCKECSRLAECGGCEKCKGHPFDGSFVAERNINFVDLKQSLIS